REAIALARATAAQRGMHDRRAHVGYYLVDQGRPQLEPAVGWRPSWKPRVGRAGRHLRLLLYLGSILLLTLLSIAGALSVLGSGAGRLDAGDWRLWFFALPLVIAASALAHETMPLTFKFPDQKISRQTTA
ncbi:MAG: hypothetical protein ACNA7J_06530, partial [Wenzhouxiangella sp.]